MFGARLVMPGLVAALSAPASEGGVAARMATVVTFGTLVMGLIDAAFLAYQPAPRRPDKPVGTSWYPMVDLSGNRASLGVGGAF
jgi:hypothetical protein